MKLIYHTFRTTRFGFVHITTQVSSYTDTGSATSKLRLTVYGSHNAAVLHFTLNYVISRSEWSLRVYIPVSENRFMNSFE